MITSKLANSTRLLTAFTLGAALAVIFCLLLLGHINFLDSLSYEAATLGSFFIPVVIFATICHFKIRAARRQATQNIIDFAHVPMFLLNADNHCVISNRQAQSLLGYAPQDIAHRPLSATCIAAHQAVAFDRFLAGTELDEISTTQLSLKHHRGDLIEVELVARRARNVITQKIETLIIVQDIKLAIEARAELFRSNLELEHYLETATAVIFGLDTDRRVTLWNHATSILTGLSQKRAMGQRLSLDKLRSPSTDLQQVIDDALLGIETEHLDFTVARFNGKTTHMLINATTRRDAHGKIIGALFTATDVTHVREQEHQSSQTNKMIALGNLTGGVAHDFNNLLTVIIGNLTLLTEDKQTLTDFEFDEIANDALSAANDGARLTQQLLLFARQQRLEPVLTNINELVYNLVRRITRNLGEQVTLKVTPHESSPFGLVDPAMLESAITNLCFNARDALDANGQIEIVVGLRTINTSEMSLATDSAAGDYVSISVIDNGAGIPAAALKHIFEPFWTTKPLGKGSGLGLSMVQGFAAQSSGFVTIDNAVDEPTKVTLNLPKYSAPAPSGGISAPLINKKQPSQVNFKLAKILVVEDEAIVRAYAVRCLKSLGHRTVQAANAAEAIDILQQDPQISVVFSDIRMPGALSGRDLQQLITERYPHIKILLTTGYEDLAKIAAGKADKAFNDKITILKKPYTRASLTETLASLT
ncbi:PAS domain-containing protein [Pseudomonadales bacterium]|nr:PAS domain-containing protein [Pseudomonadales bacterium]